MVRDQGLPFHSKCMVNVYFKLHTYVACVMTHLPISLKL